MKSVFSKSKFTADLIVKANSVFKFKDLRFLIRKPTTSIPRTRTTTTTTTTTRTRTIRRQTVRHRNPSYLRQTNQKTKSWKWCDKRRVWMIPLSIKVRNLSLYLSFSLIRGRFQHFTCSFYKQRSQKRKKYCQAISLFVLLGFLRIEAAQKMLVKSSNRPLETLQCKFSLVT